MTTSARPVAHKGGSGILTAIPEGEILGSAPHVDERGMKILASLAAGESNEDMAAALEVSDRTVKTAIAQLCGLFGAKNRTHLVAQALRTKVIK